MTIDLVKFKRSLKYHQNYFKFVSFTAVAILDLHPKSESKSVSIYRMVLARYFMETFVFSITNF